MSQTHADSDRVIIAGAGIGGLTTALTLARVGIACTIVERRTALTEGGAGIQLSPNASRVLFELGLGPALTRRAVEPTGVAIRALGSGNTLTKMTLGAGMRERYGAPYLVISRDDLHTILLDAVRSRTDTRILVGRMAIGARTEGESALVEVETSNGQRDHLAGPLAIAADGVWSRLRPAIGFTSKPRFRGYNAWRALLPADKLPPDFALSETGLWLGAGKHLVHYAVAGGKSVNLVAVVRAKEALPGWGVAGDARQIMQHFRSAAAPVQAMLAGAADWRIWSLHDLAPPAHWHVGRVALLGDAAHPVLPFLAQGGALAIEDAAVLAAKLAPALVEEEVSLATALAAYGAERHARAVRVQKAGRSNGRTYHLPAPLSLARNMVMQHLGGAGMLERYGWLYGWTHDGSVRA